MAEIADSFDRDEIVVCLMAGCSQNLLSTTKLKECFELVRCRFQTEVVSQSVKLGLSGISFAHKRALRNICIL